MPRVADAVKTIRATIVRLGLGPYSRELTPEARKFFAEWTQNEIIPQLVVALRQLDAKITNGRCAVCRKLFPLYANMVVQHKDNSNAIDVCSGSELSPSEVV